MTASAAVPLPAAADAQERLRLRRAVLRSLGADDAGAEELLRYGESAFRFPAEGVPPLPLPDEPFATAWQDYADEAAARGAFPVLREKLVQLRFPIAAGMRATEAYQAATRRGVFPPQDAPGVVLEDPDGVRLFLHPTAAGRIPVIVAERRADFVALVRALARRNEPDPVPPSMGALMVGGFVNWDRVARLRAAWEAGEVDLGEMAEWSPGAIAGRKELYQDRFVVLSTGPYSGVAAGELGLGEEEWRRTSLLVRLEHECAHYFTRRVLGSMRNALHDEVIADYCGIAAATGQYRADWFLRFLGLEDAERYRPGGRLENYRGDPPLSDAAFAVLQRLVRRAAARLEALDAALPEDSRSLQGRARMVLALAALTVEELAAV